MNERNQTNQIMTMRKKERNETKFIKLNPTSIWLSWLGDWKTNPQWMNELKSEMNWLTECGMKLINEMKLPAMNESWGWNEIKLNANWVWIEWENN